MYQIARNATIDYDRRAHPFTDLSDNLPLPVDEDPDLAALTFWERSGLIWRDPLSLEWEFVHRGFEQFGRALYLHSAWKQTALAPQVEALQRATLG
ncbi:hypothetical protein [Chloroflexus aggregans]|uniref:hypothetical protein n=1 Tax=Chloroflexus aggregans TaxID=152260 RepID=UPI000312481D|nr:hypothetical protein [Chloroflexus aggregans]